MAALTEDHYPGQVGVNTPPKRFYTVTLSDTEYLNPLPKCLYIGHDGSAGPARSNLVIEGDDGVTVTLSVVPGQVLSVRPRRVWSTGSTAGVVVIAGV